MRSCRRFAPMTRVEGTGLLAVLAACVGLAGPGCGSMPDDQPVPYPTDWPSPVEGVTCSKNSLRFKNGAVASTYLNSASPPASERIQLNDVLQDGGYLKHADQPAAPADIIELNCVAHSAVRIETVNHRRVPVSSTARWRCTEGGSIELTFPAYSGGGESTLSSTVEVVVTLTLMQDGDLAVRSFSAAKSVIFPGVTHFREGVDWIRFRRAD